MSLAARFFFTFVLGLSGSCSVQSCRFCFRPVLLCLAYSSVLCCFASLSLSCFACLPSLYFTKRDAATFRLITWAGAERLSLPWGLDACGRVKRIGWLCLLWQDPESLQLARALRFRRFRADELKKKQDGGEIQKQIVPQNRGPGACGSSARFFCKLFWTFKLALWGSLEPFRRPLNTLWVTGLNLCT